MTSLHQIFSFICGQAHVWTVGGQTLPLCQRCTGLYPGAAAALLLWLLLRPRPTATLLWIHGAALLLMVPFGYHLVPHGPDVRTLTGFVFGAGLVCFLLLVPASWVRVRHSDHGQPYVAGVFVGAATLMLALHFGGMLTASILAWSSLAGLAALAVLAAANLLLIPLSLRRATAP